MNYTPGRWEIRKNKNDELEIWAEGFWIAILPHQCLRSVEDQQKVNARLVAAAPDLLEALQGVYNNVKDDSPEMWVRVARAIERATGEKP